MLGYLGYDDAKLRKKNETVTKLVLETGRLEKAPPCRREIEQIILKLRHC